MLFFKVTVIAENQLVCGNDKEICVFPWRSKSDEPTVYSCHES